MSCSTPNQPHQGCRKMKNKGTTFPISFQWTTWSCLLQPSLNYNPFPLYIIFRSCSMEALSSSVFIPPFQETRSSSTSSTSLRLNFCFPKTTLPGFRSRGIAAVTREVAGDGEDDEQPLVDDLDFSIVYMSKSRFFGSQFWQRIKVWKREDEGLSGVERERERESLFNI